MNFKKKSIFHRGEDDAYEPEVQEESGGMLAVWGSPGSGKTITAVKLAKALAEKKKNVALVMCDMTAPMLPCVCPPSDLECERSLGGILAVPRISDTLIKNNCITHKRLSYLTILGMKKGENEYTYPPYTEQQATEFLDGLRELVPFISQLPLLKDTKWDADKQYKVASNIKPQQAAEHIGKVLGAVSFKLPYSQELEEQYLAGTLLSALSKKASRTYRKELEKIIKEVFGC
jgi:hypothetical protein